MAAMLFNQLVGEMLTGNADMFDPARVTDLEGYMAQTMGNTINQMETATWVTVIVGLCGI